MGGKVPRCKFEADGSTSLLSDWFPQIQKASSSVGMKGSMSGVEEGSYRKDMLSLEIIKAALKHIFTELKALIQQHFLHFIYKGTGLGNKTYLCQ